MLPPTIVPTTAPTSNQQEAQAQLDLLRHELASLQGFSPEKAQKIVNDLTTLLECTNYDSFLETIQSKSDLLFALKQQETSKNFVNSSLVKTVEIQEQCIQILENLNADLEREQDNEHISTKLASLKATKDSLKETLRLKEKLFSEASMAAAAANANAALLQPLDPEALAGQMDDFELPPLS